MDYRIEHFQKYNDVRGQLVVFLRNSDLEPKLKKFGQIYFVTFDKQGVVRGNHYHKKWREWFGVVSGKVDVYLKDIKSGKEKKLVLDGNSKKYIRLEIGPNIAHAFRNRTKYASLINYTNIEWTKTDTYPYKLF